MTIEYRSAQLTQDNLNNDHIYITPSPPARGRSDRDTIAQDLMSVFD